MKLPLSTAFAAALILAAGPFQPRAASAQDDMKNMPGMATPKPKKPAASATPKPATAPAMKDMPGMAPAAPAVSIPTDNAASAEQKKMDAMPGMAPTSTPAAKRAGAASAQAEMDAMPGMTPAKPGSAASTKKESMAGMPGMAGGAAAKKGGMAAMPGMDAGAPPAQRMSAPGVTVLGPHQKWVPPRGDNRAAELLSRPMLEAHMKGLPPPVEDSMIHSFMLFDLLEYRAYNSGPATLTWDFVGWIGGDYNRLWIKSEGDLSLSRGNATEGDLQLLYGRLIAPFWNLQLGLRHNRITRPNRSDNSRTYAVIGLQGLAPGRFDIEPSLYISDRGEVSGEITVSADYYLTQRLVLQPRFEGQFSFQGDRKFDTASGVNQTDLGVRLRYEITREFAPYIGVTWQRKYGGTASIARSSGDSTDAVAFVLGLRLWF